MSKQDVEIGEAGNSLCMLGGKFCPTPKTLTNETKHYENFVRWRENIRWKYHFAKDKDLTQPEPEFQKEPWYQRTSRSAPIARDCPELEAMLAGVERDLFDPALRKKIKDKVAKGVYI